MEKIVQGIDVKDCEYIYTDRDNDLCCAASIGGAILMTEKLMREYISKTKE